MALPVVESFSAGSYALDGASCVVTKPTGLAVGEIMSASAVSHSDSGTAPTITPPAGWSTYITYTDESFVIQYNFYKVAEAADVAASNFTFTSGGGTNTRIIVGIARISGGISTLATGSATGHVSNTTGSNSFTVSLNTTYPDVLLLLQIIGRDPSSRTFSGYTTSGTNPTWTEHMDSSNADTVDTSFAVASAGITTPRTLTNFTVTASGDLEDCYLVVLAIPAQANATGTNALLNVSPAFFSQSGSADTNGSNALLAVSPAFFSQSGKGTTPTQWTNEPPATTTWVNESE